MTTYNFHDNRFMSIAFNPATDVLFFPTNFSLGYGAPGLRFVQDGPDLRVYQPRPLISDPLDPPPPEPFVELIGLTFNDLTDANFSFQNGGVVRLDTAGGDALTGGSENDYIDIRKGGNDAVTASGGFDAVFAGAALTADDQIAGRGVGDPTSDRLFLSGVYAAPVVFNATTLTGVSLIDVVDGGSVSLTLHDNTVFTAADDHRLQIRGAASSQLTVDAAAVVTGSVIIEGGAGDDVLTGGANADSMLGGGGIDMLTGGGGADNVHGGDRNDFVSGGSGDDFLTGGAGADVVLGGDDNDTLVGFGLIPSAFPDGIDGLVGGAGNDILTGGADADVLTGGLDADIFRAVAGDSTFAAPDEINDFNRGEGDRIGLFFSTPGDGFFNSKPLIFRGELPAGFVYAQGSGLPGADIGAGFSQVWWARVGSGASAKTVLIVDTDANFVLGASDFVMTLTGSSPANLTMFDFEAVVGTPGNDVIAGTSVKDFLYGVLGNDTLQGGAGNDELGGGAGNDALDGGADNDFMAGGPGNDTYFVDNPNDIVREETGEGFDVVNAAANFTLMNLFDGWEIEVLNLTGSAVVGIGNQTANRIVGNGLGNTLEGGGGNDALIGNAGADTLRGDSGNDMLDGGDGNDTLTGGADDDRFVATPGGDADNVTDFVEGAGSIDRADIRAFTAIRSFADVLARATQVGSDTLIDFGGGDTLTLSDVAKMALHADDFILANPPSNDFNGDAKSDILWRHQNGTANVFLMDGATVIGGSNTSLQVDNNWQAQDKNDFNGDGRADILWRHANGTSNVFLMDGAAVIGGSNTSLQVDNNWQIRGTDDFNGDGKADILWRHNNGTSNIFLMDGATVIGGSNTSLQVDNAWQVAGTGDLNGDGHADILWRHQNGTANVFLMNGTTVIGGSNISQQLDNNWTVRGVDDFNGDGRADILWRHTDGTSNLFTMNGATVLGSANTSLQIDNAWAVADTGDYNGDGKADILWRHQNGTTNVFLMDGPAVTGGSNTSLQVDNAWHVV